MHINNRDRLPWFLYHPTGVIFRYVRSYSEPRMRLTHAIIPVNWDNLFEATDVEYSGFMKSAYWPYHKIKAENEYKPNEDLVKLYLMIQNDTKFMGYFKGYEFANSGNFLVKKLN